MMFSVFVGGCWGSIFQTYPKTLGTRKHSLKTQNDFPGKSKFMIAQVKKNILGRDSLSLLSILRILICGSEALWRLDKQYSELSIAGP